MSNFAKRLSNGGFIKMKKRKIILAVLLITIIATLFIGCATATQVPPGATPEQIEQINAQNNAATATNTSTMAAVTLVSIILSLLSLIGQIAVAAGN
jgi:Na+-transporting methylmalonyl-CoA/oxaloacetate decarboxylase gamma subunit